MSVNRISLTITDVQKTAVSDATETLHDATKDLYIVVSNDEIKSLSTISDGRLPFVEKAVEYSVSNPEHLPAIVDAAEMKKDFETFSAVREMIRPLRQILDNLENTMFVSGSEAWEAARNYYKQVQLNAKMGVPGAQAIYDDLRRLFEARNIPVPTE